MESGDTGLAGVHGTPGAARATVVCIDDDPLVESVFLAAAKRAGVSGVFAANALAFERAVAMHAPAVVVLDQVMPDRTGAEQILWLRGLARRPGVIVIGADALYLESASALVKAAGLRLVASLSKPLRLGTFAEALRSAAAG